MADGHPHTAAGPDSLDYQGDELGVFLHAENWKRYFRSRVAPFIRGRVLEVAAGMGGTTRLLCTGNEQRWVCVEPDGKLLALLEERRASGEIPAICEPVHGTLRAIPAEDRFDSILYVDVLEHIEDDREEFARAVAHLAPGGAIVVIGPAHQFLFSPFDKAIGHFRRYNLSRLRELAAEFTKQGVLVQRKLEYLDSIGLFASLANRLVLQQKSPSLKQILFWDRILVRLSRIVDPVLLFRAGKSVVGVWERT